MIPANGMEINSTSLSKIASALKEATTYIANYLKKVEEGKVDGLGLDEKDSISRAKIIKSQMQKKIGKDFVTDPGNRSGKVSDIGGVFPFITEVRVFEPKTHLSFEFNSGETTLNPDFLKSLDNLQNNHNLEAKFFAQMADLDFVGKGNKIDTPKKLEDLFKKVENKDKVTEKNLTDQEQALVKMYHLALGRSLTAATAIHDQQTVDNINEVYDKDPYKTWEAAKENGWLEEMKINKGNLLSDYVVLAPSLNDKNAKRSTVSPEEYQITRNNKGTGLPDNRFASYAGIQEAKETKVNIVEPGSIFDLQQQAFNQEISEINRDIEAVKSSKTDIDPYRDFGEWVDRQKNDLREKGNKPPIETNKTPEKKTEILKQSTLTETKPETKKPQVKLGELIIKKDNTPNLEKSVPLKYKGLNTENSTFLDDIDATEVPVFPLISGLVGTAVHLYKRTALAVSRINEPDELNKKTKNIISNSFSKFIEDMDKQNPDISCWKLQK